MTKWSILKQYSKDKGHDSVIMCIRDRIYWILIIFYYVFISTFTFNMIYSQRLWDPSSKLFYGYVLNQEPYLRFLKLSLEGKPLGPSSSWPFTVFTSFRLRLLGKQMGDVSVNPLTHFRCVWQALLDCSPLCSMIH